jgi:hypothetical protein
MPGIRTHPAEVPREEFITQSSDTEAGADGEIVSFTDRELALIALSVGFDEILSLPDQEYAASLADPSPIS